MSVEATERWDGREWNVSSNQITAQREWDVVGTIDETQVLNAPGAYGNDPVPHIGDRHRLNPYLVCNSVKAKHTGHRFWRVTASYSFTVAQDPTDPLRSPPVIQYRSGNCTEPIDRDIHGNPITNSVGDALTPPPTRYFATKYLTITRYEPYFDAPRLMTFENKVNDRDITIATIGTLRKGQMLCTTIEPAGTFTRNNRIVQVQYNFELRADGFKFRTLDQGTNALYLNGWPMPGRLYRNNEEVTKDVLLNGRGVPIESGFKVGPKRANPYAGQVPTGAEVENAPQVNRSGLRPVFLKYELYEGIDFTLLRL